MFHREDDKPRFSFGVFCSLAETRVKDRVLLSTKYTLYFVLTFICRFINQDLAVRYHDEVRLLTGEAWYYFYDSLPLALNVISITSHLAVFALW